MQITVLFEGRTLKIEPDPAYVRIGEPVDWVVRYLGGPFPKLMWTVYFDHGVPFPRGTRQFTVKTSAVSVTEAQVRHEGLVEGGEPEDEGEYKYGVRIADQKSGFKVADDDPYLIVRP